MNLFNNEFKDTHRINTLPFRSHYIPFALDDNPSYIFGIIDNASSSRYFSLCGEWEIKEHVCVEDICDINEKLDSVIKVPSVVQLNGFDQIQYINDKYPFPFNPPNIPRDNPAYHYRKTLSFHKKDGYVYHINFEGVDSAFYLFVNGVKVGYSLISHSKSEFDITEQLVDGTNTFDVIVLKWNACSYLECQDKFRFTGIFRDVYILTRPKNHIFDFKVTPICDNGYYVKIDNISNDIINVSFLNKDYSVDGNSFVLIKLDNPIFWSSENPYLYDLKLSNNDEVIYHKFGFIVSKIKDGIFVLNDKHIKLKGVNRHETHPVKGPAIDTEDIYNDLVLIKSYNCNAIRTSHYPNIPEFYELCNVLGIYVLDEADIECHGAAYNEKQYDLKHWRKFANNGLFDSAILDREISLYERDKNYTCVVIFSLGNESSFGKMFYKGIEYLKEHDSRPIQYEGLANIDKDEEYYNSGVDILSRMYPSYSYLEEYLKDDKETRPLVLCEYSHAMGNSCGDIKDYWDIMMTSDRFIGGFVWEWCDHSLLVNGKLIYGGDSGESLHDGNFCVDGLVDAFRNPKSGVLEMKSVYDNSFKKNEEIVELEKWPQCKKDAPVYLKINKDNGDIDEVIANGKTLNAKPIKMQFTRADIDNDSPYKDEINRVRNAHIKVVNYVDNKYYEALLIDENRKELLTFNVNFETFNDSFDVDISYELLDDIRITRVGFEIVVPKDRNSKVTYHGYGPEETYIDKHHWASVDTYSFEVEDNYNHSYLKPQENGSRYHCSFFKTDTFMVIANKPFSFNALSYGLNELLSTKHDYELNGDSFNHFSIDLFMSGVGSHSCGPELKKQYSVPYKMNTKFKIILR